MTDVKNDILKDVMKDVAKTQLKNVSLKHKYSKALMDFFVDHIENGETARSICQKFPETVPDEKTYYRWKKRYPEFGKAVNEAYQTFFYKKMDELEELSKTLMEEQEEMKAMTKEECMSRRLYIDSIRLRIDTLKFTLAKLAPKLVPDLRDSSTQQNVMVQPNITIIRYDSQASDQLLLPVQHSTKSSIVK